MREFAAIDFETANNELCSVCSVGVVIVRDNKVVDKIYELIKPAPNYYKYWNTKVHGLTRYDTDTAMTFPEVWQMIAPKIKGLPLVAHNSMFDEACLKAVHKYYGLIYPDYKFFCTYRTAKKQFKDAALPNHKLHTVAAYVGYNLENHHHALADAEACAAIASVVL